MCFGVGGVFNFLLATDQAANAAKLNKAKDEARLAKNERAGAESELQRFNQSLTNKKIMEQAGRNLGALSENLFRRMDAAAYGGIMAELQLSENLGATAAAAASAGIGGSSVESYNATMRTAYGLQKELRDRSTASDVYLSSEQIGRVIPDAVDSFDRNVYRANLDFTYYGPTKGPSVLGSLAKLAVAGAATAAGAPGIGTAILNASTSGMQASYGDAQGAQASMVAALGGFKDGVGQMRDKIRISNGGSTPGIMPGKGNGLDFWPGFSTGGINPSAIPSWSPFGGSNSQSSITFR